ncbi:MAG TPA: NYN domain-containing protein [Nocardioidaceae bacterium]|nr:NYN domain-containing protein [Nocardioidaceae bacterium]
MTTARTSGSTGEGGEKPDTEGEESTDRGLTGPLPEAVRVRVVALAADALGSMPAEQLPAPLKRVASFAPGRRAKLAGTQIAGVLETDETFRDRLGIQVRARVAELAQALEEGTTPAAADPVELAAVAYLLRPDGWVDVVERAAGVADAERTVAVTREVSQQVERLRRQLDEVHAELRETRDRNRQQVAALKAENSELRHKLGDARARLKSAEEAARVTESRAEAAVTEAAAAAATSEAELRRLRARLEELEREIATARRAGRVEKDEGTLRARLLLDTLLETAQGLRRELALPPVEKTPADAVEADVAEQGARTPTSHGSLASDDPALLDQLLALPRVHLIVDGYNVTKEAWPDCSLEIQRDRLLGGLAPLAARTQAEVTVVFDAADKVERPLVTSPRRVRVLYSPFGVIADDVIRQLVAVEPTGRPVVVVTSDQAVARDVQRGGARAVGAVVLSRLLGRV